MQDIYKLAADKTYLRAIANNNYTLPGDIDRFGFLQALLQNFDTTDSELRDELTYMILARPIIDAKNATWLSGAQREDLLLTCVDGSHLFYHLGEAGTDSVFMRSFSLLIVAALLYADAKLQQISEQATRQVTDALLRYAREERDWRGHITGKGWAHAVAHLSDALDECAQNRYITTAERETILHTLTYLATLPEPLCNEEDDRLSFLAHRVIANQQVEEVFLEHWIESFYVAREEHVPGGTEQDVAAWVSAANARNFLRSLYFRLLWEQKDSLLLDKISNMLKRLASAPFEEPTQ